MVRAAASALLLPRNSGITGSLFRCKGATEQSACRHTLTHPQPLRLGHCGGFRARCRVGCRGGPRRHASCCRSCSCSYQNRLPADEAERACDIQTLFPCTVEANEITGKPRNKHSRWINDKDTAGHAVTLAIIRGAESVGEVVVGEPSESDPPS